MYACTVEVFVFLNDTGKIFQPNSSRQIKSKTADVVSVHHYTRVTSKRNE